MNREAGGMVAGLREVAGEALDQAAAAVRAAAAGMPLVLAKLAGSRTLELICWPLDHGVMPLYTPAGRSWLNMAGSLQSILKRRALSGRHPTDTAQIIALLEAARHWDATPITFVWGVKRAARRRHERRHRLGDMLTCTDPARHQVMAQASHMTD